MTSALWIGDRMYDYVRQWFVFGRYPVILRKPCWAPTRHPSGPRPPVSVKAQIAIAGWSLLVSEHDRRRGVGRPRESHSNTQGPRAERERPGNRRKPIYSTETVLDPTIEDRVGYRTFCCLKRTRGERRTSSFSLFPTDIGRVRHINTITDGPKWWLKSFDASFGVCVRAVGGGSENGFFTPTLGQTSDAITAISRSFVNNPSHVCCWLGVQIEMANRDWRGAHQNSFVFVFRIHRVDVERSYTVHKLHLILVR